MLNVVWLNVILSSVIILNVPLMNVILLTVVVLNGPMLTVIVPSDMLRNVLQNVIMLNVIRFSNVAPFQRSSKGKH